MDELNSGHGHRMSFDSSSIEPSILQYIHQIDSEEPRPRNTQPPPRPPRLKRVIRKVNEPAHHGKAPGKPILKQSPSPSSPGLPPPGGFAAQQQQFLDSIYEAQESDAFYESSENTRRNGMDLERAQLNVNARNLAVPEPLDNEFWAPGHWKAKTKHPTTFIHAEGLPHSSEGNGFRHAPLHAVLPSVSTSAASIPINAVPPTSAFSIDASDASDIIEKAGDATQTTSRPGTSPNANRSVPAPAFRANSYGQPGWFPDFHPAYESNYTKRRPAPQVPEDIEEPQTPESPRRTFPSRPSFTFRAPSHAPTLQRQHSVVSPYTPHPWTPNPFEADFRPGQRSSAYFSPVVTPSANPWEDEVSGAKRKAEDDQQRRKKRRVAFALPKSFKSDHPKIIRQQTPYYDSSFSTKIRKLVSKISRVFRNKSPEERQAEKERKLREKRDRMESEESEELRSGYSGHEWADSGSGERDSGDNEYVY